MRLKLYYCTPLDALPGASRCVLLSTYTVRRNPNGTVWFHPNTTTPYKLGLWDQPTEVNKIGPDPSKDDQWPAKTVLVGDPTWPRPSFFDPNCALYALEPNVTFNAGEDFPGWLSVIKDGDLVMPDLDNLHPMPDLITSWGHFETTERDAIVGRKRRKAVGEYIREWLDKTDRKNCKTVLYGGFPIRWLATGDQNELDQMKMDHLAWINEGVYDAWDMAAWNGYWQYNHWHRFNDFSGDALKILSTIPPVSKPLGVVFRPYYHDHSTPMEYSILTRIFDFFKIHFDFVIIWHSQPIPSSHEFWKAYSEFIES